MRIPYVIDNQSSKLADVLNGILAEHAHSSLDVASAYFNVGGFKELQANLAQLRSFRLLLGFEPKAGADVGLRPERKALNMTLQADLAREPFSEATLRLVEDLIGYLRRPEVAVRLYDVTSRVVWILDRLNQWMETAPISSAEVPQIAAR